MELHNELRAKLGRDEVTFGVTVGLGSLEVSETLGNLGLDYITFDMQHTSLDAEKTSNDSGNKLFTDCPHRPRHL